SGSLLKIHHAEVVIGVFIGAVTLTGSVIAYLKLTAKVKSAPLMLPGKDWLNIGALVAFVVLTVVFVIHPSMWLLIVVTVLALALGLHLVAAIGGGDMPVVISMLNSYSGWAAAAAGFLLNNNLLIVTGALVGSSGAYLSYIMCKAMNRSFISVIAGGFGIEASSGGDDDMGEYNEVTAEGAAELLRDAESVIITPGYGMAVRRPGQQPARPRRQRPVRRASGGRTSARTHERPAGRSQGALRHRPGNGRDQRRLRRNLGSLGDRRQRHGQPRRVRRPHQP